MSSPRLLTTVDGPVSLVTINGEEYPVGTEEQGAGGLLAFVSVKFFGAKGDGVADDTAAFQTAFNAVADTGVALWIPTGIYRHTSQIQISPDTIVWGSPGAVIKQALVGAANTSAWAASPTFGVSSLLTADNVPGTKVVQCAVHIPNGTRVFVGDAATPGPSAACSTYTVISAAAAGPDWNLTLDRVVLGSYSSGVGSVTPMTSYPAHIHIHGNGMTFSGTSGGTLTGYLGLGAALGCKVDNVRADATYGQLSANGVALNFDLGSVDCVFLDCFVNGGGGVNMQGFALQGCENVSAEDCKAVNCGTGFTLADGFLCNLVGPAGGDNTSDIAFVSNNAASSVGVSTATVRGAAFSGSTNGCNLAYGSSDNVFSGCRFYSCVNTGFWVQNNNGGCTGLDLEDFKVIGGCGVAGIFISGNEHQLEGSGVTVDFVTANGIEVTGAGCRVMLEGLSSYDSATNGSSGVLLVNGASDVIVKRSYMQLGEVIASWFAFVPQGGCTLSVDDAIVEQAAGVGGVISVAFQINALCNVRLRNCRTVGPVEYGVNGGAFAWIVRNLGGLDFNSCTVAQYQLNAAGKYNRGTVAANGVNPVAIAFNDMQPGENLKLVSTGATPTAYLHDVTAKVPSIAASMGDANTYDYEIS